MNHGGKIRMPGARGRAAGILALAGAAVLGYVLLQPTGSADIPGWEPVNAQVAKALGDAAGAGSPATTAAAAGAQSSPSAEGSAKAGAPSAGQAASDSPAGQAGAVGASTAGTAAAGQPSANGSGQAAPPAADSSAGASGVAATGASPDSSEKLNLNEATAEQLDALKGIGPAKAQAIVDYREQQGPFHSVYDLLQVKGIGSKLLAGIRAEVTV